MNNEEHPLKLYQIHIVSMAGELHTFSSFAPSLPEVKARAWLEAYAITEELETTHLFDMKEFCHDYDMLYFEIVEELPRPLDDYAVVRENALMVKRLLKRENRESAFDYDSLLTANRAKLRATLTERASADVPEGAWYDDMTPEEIGEDIAYAAAASLKFSDMARIVASKTGIQYRAQGGVDENTPKECLKWAIIEQLGVDFHAILEEFADKKAENEPESD